MRNIERDTRKVYVSHFEGYVREEDDQGRLTGKNIPKRSTPEEFYPTISIAKGESYGTYFGINLDYDRVLIYDDPEFPLEETDYFWIDVEIGDLDDPNPHDYVAKRVSKGSSYVFVAIAKVEVAR